VDLAVVQWIEARVAQRGLHRDAAGPDSFGEERRRDVEPLPGALSPIQRRHDRGIDTDGGGVIAAARYGKVGGAPASRVSESKPLRAQ